MDERYLDPDIHLWLECPDDRCFVCGKEFPADLEIEEGMIEYEGFCSELCKTRELCNQQRKGTYKLPGGAA